MSQAAGTCYEVGNLILMMIKPRGLMQAAGACCEAGGFTVDGDVATWADVGGGRVL